MGLLDETGEQVNKYRLLRKEEKMKTAPAIKEQPHVVIV